MPALYGITSNANVSVSNTTGLYIGSGNVTILNSAGTLLNLLSNAGTVGFYSTNSGTQVAASVDPSGVTSGTYGSDTAIPVITVGADGRVTSVTLATNAGGTYGNANVTALLSGTVTVGNLITTAGVYWANGQPYSSGSGTIYGNANVAAYLAANTDPTIQSLNANTSQQAAQINSINANIGSFYTYANVTYSTIANAASQESEISSLRGNITAANASIQTLSANLGSFETYANVTYVTTANATIYSNANVASYLAANTDPTISNLNANTSQQAAQINSINANVGSFYTYANVTYATNANLASTNANLAAFETYANVTFGPSGPSSYSNANVASYLPIYSGAINNSSTIIGINANVTAANAAIQTLNANVGSFYTYANATYSTIANAASQESEISSLRSNITAANAAIQTLSANLGSFETYANVTFVTTANATTYSNSNVASYLSSGLVNTISTTGNITTTANVVANNASITNQLSVGNIIATGTETAGNIITTAGVYWANGVSYGSSFAGTYGNTNVTALLSSNTVSTISTTGNIRTIANIISPSYLYPNGVSILTGITSTYSNTNVSALLSSNTVNTINTTGDITATTNINANKFVSGTTYIQNGIIEDSLDLNLIATNDIQETTGRDYQLTAGGVASYYANGGIFLNPNYNGSTPSQSNVYIQSGSGLVTTGNITAGNLTVANTATVGNLITTGGVYWANGAAYSSSSGSGSIYGNSNVATFLSSGFGSNTIVTTGNITAGNITNTGVITSTGNITAPYHIGTAQYFSGNLAGNVLYDGLKNTANIQAAAFGNINPINSSALSQYQQSGQGGVGTASAASISPAPAVYTYFSGNGVTAITTAGIASMISQANVTVRTSAAIQTIVGQSFQTQGYGLGAGNMSTNDRIKGQIAAMELWPQGATWGSNQFSPHTGTDFVPYVSNAVAIAIQAQLSLTGSGNVSSAAGQAVISYVAPTVGAMNVNYVTGMSASVGYGSYANVSGIGISTINIARGLLVTGSYANTATPTNQVINNLYGVHLPTNWENNGTPGRTITYLKRSLQSEDVNTDLYNAGNVIIGGNLITTSTTAPITFNSPTTHNSNVTVAGSNSLLKVTTFTVTALNAITGSTGQFAAVSNGTGKSGGQMAYWDTTNSRWSWFDTNLAVS